MLLMIDLSIACSISLAKENIINRFLRKLLHKWVVIFHFHGT